MRTKDLFLFFLAFAISFSSTATHLRGGFITMKRISGLTYQIQVHVYTSETEVHFSHNGSGILDFGDGTSINLPEEAGVVRTDIDPDGTTRFVLVTIQHTFPGNGSYVVSYQENNRNAGIINMNNSVNTSFYIESMINTRFSQAICPAPIAPPVFRMSADQEAVFSLEASTEHAALMLQYEMVTPKKARGTSVENFTIPGQLTINRNNGTISWKDGDTPRLLGEYNFAVLIKAYDGTYLCGSTVVDFQVILNDENGPLLTTDSTIQENGRVFIPADSTHVFTFTAEDIRTPKLLVFSPLFDHTVFTKGLVKFDTVTDSDNHITGTLTINSTSELTQDLPYPILIRAVGASGHVTDIPILFYTKDVYPPPPPVVAGAENPVAFNDVYPNPVTDYLYVDNASHEHRVVNLFDANGKMMFSEKTSTAVVIDMRAMPNGIYFLQTNKQQTQLVQRVVKQD